MKTIESLEARVREMSEEYNRDTSQMAQTISDLEAKLKASEDERSEVEIAHGKTAISNQELKAKLAVAIEALEEIQRSAIQGTNRISIKVSRLIVSTLSKVQALKAKEG